MNEFLAWTVIYLIVAFVAIPALIGDGSYRKSLKASFSMQLILCVVLAVVMLGTLAVDTLTK